MKKSELIKDAARRSGKAEADVRAVLSALTESIEDAMALGGKVTLPGFGTFGVRDVAAQTRRNPATGQPMISPAGRAAYFKAGTGLKAKVTGQVAIAASALTGASA